MTNISLLLYTCLCTIVIYTDCKMTQDTRHSELMRTKSTLLKKLHKILTRKLKSSRSIDEVIEAASEPGTFTSATFIPDQEAIAFEGDMLMLIPQFAEMEVNSTDSIDLSETLRNIIQKYLRLHNKHTRKIRAARRTERHYWPKAVIPLRISGSGFGRSSRRRMARGLNRISEKTCVCFRPISKSEARKKVPHVRIIEGQGCRSYVGMSVRNQHSTLSQDMILSRRCRSSAVFSHEILHVLGLFHEHSRPDRDEYVDIQLQNTIGRSRINFNRIGPKNINSRGVDYDYLSLMHYGSKAFSKNGNYTIVPRPDNNRKRYLNQIGRSRRISKGDARVINLMYRCRMPRPSRPTCSKYPYRL